MRTDTCGLRAPLNPDLWGASQMVWVGKQPWDPCWKSPLFACLGFGHLKLWTQTPPWFSASTKNVAFRVAEKQLENLPKLLCNSWDIHALMSSFFSVRKSWNAVKLRRFSCYSTLQLCLEIDAELLHLFYTQICGCWSLEEPMWDLPKYIIEIFIDIQGGGGSFKLRKPIGEIGCCESRMAEQRYWWINRCFRSPRFLSLSCPDSDYLPTNPSFFLPFLLTYLLTFLSFFLSTYRSIDLSIYLSTASICLPVYLFIFSCNPISSNLLYSDLI